MSQLLDMLAGGDRRSLGRVDEVVRRVLRRPYEFATLMMELATDDPVLRMRVADAVEKITAQDPDLLKPFKRQFLGPIAGIRQAEVQWHVAQILPRLHLTDRERGIAVKILVGYLAMKSRIVRTFALQALADLAARDPSLRRRVRRLLEDARTHGPPALRARARQLLTQLASLAGS